MNNSNIIGHRIREIRKARKLKQKDFAQIIGIHKVHVSRLENGLSAPSLGVIKRICREFRVYEAWLREGKGPMEYPSDFTFEHHEDLLLKLEASGYQQIMDRFDFLNKALRRVIEASAGLKDFHRETGQPTDPRMGQLRKAKAKFDQNLSELQKLFSKLFD